MRRLKRFWADAREKVTSERVCRLHRLGDCQGAVEAAHVIGRSHDMPMHDYLILNGHQYVGYDLYVHPDSIAPLCTRHHRAYDAHEIDVLHVLSLDEQLQAVRDAGGIALALRRISGRPDPKREAA